MSAPRQAQGGGSAQSRLLIPILLMFALFSVAVLRSPSLMSSSGIGSAIIVAAPMILATYALTFIVMAGRGGVDLSIGPLIGFINVTLVQLYAAGIVESVFQTFVYAFAVGVAYQLLMGLVIVYVRIQPIIVALSGYLTLSGLNLMILPRPGGVAPPWMGSWGLGESIWSPVLAILAVATLAWFAFTRTAFYDHLRLMGSDERTAYASGVNITIVRLGAHAIAGLYAGLAALTFTSLIGSGDPTQGGTYTLLTVTALVLGGTSLAGGRGSITGSLLGALNIYLITYVLATFSFGKIQSFVTELSYGLILVGALLLTILLPQIQRAARSVSPTTVFVFLGLVAVGVTLYAKDSARVQKLEAAASAGVGQSLGSSLAGRSLSAGGSGGTSLAGQSLAGRSGGGTSLKAQSGGTSLKAQTGGGTSLGAQSGGGTSLAGQSLAGRSLAAGSGEAAAEAPAAGTPVVVAAVIIAAGIFALWLLYRHLSVFSVAAAGVLVLMLVGYGVHDGGASIPAALQAAEGARGPLPRFFALTLPEAAPAGASGTIFASPAVSLAVFAAGALLLATVLIFTTIPAANARVSRTALWFMAGSGAASAALMGYESQAAMREAGAGLPDGVVALLLGGLLFIVTLPAFARKIPDITTLMVALLALTGLAAAFFTVMPLGERGLPALETVAPAAPLAGWQPAGPGAPPLFYLQSFVILAGAGILFLLLMPGVRRHVLANITPGRGSARVSYTGIFVAVFAALTLGAVFVATGTPLWKYIVALVAGVIGARVLLHFLQDFRRKYGADEGARE